MIPNNYASPNSPSTSVIPSIPLYGQPAQATNAKIREAPTITTRSKIRRSQSPRGEADATVNRHVVADAGHPASGTKHTRSPVLPHGKRRHEPSKAHMLAGTADIMSIIRLTISPPHSNGKPTRVHTLTGPDAKRRQRSRMLFWHVRWTRIHNQGTSHPRIQVPKHILAHQLERITPSKLNRPRNWATETRRTLAQAPT